MPRQERMKCLKKLEEELGYPVITYVTSTRRNAEYQMYVDAVRYVYEHLKDFKSKQDKLGLLVHSFGGEPGTSWRLMNLLREYAQEIAVLVPYQAFSAATLLALGADQIVMHPMGSLGPTDPSIVGPFNPKDAAGHALPVSVEDVLSYIALVKDDVRINHEDELIQAFSKLVENVHPLALGNVKRSHSQAKLLARKLMQLRSDKPDDHKISEVVDNLTSKLYYHGHPINRSEAISLNLPVDTSPSKKVEECLWSLYSGYEVDMKLDQEFNSNAELLNATQPAPPSAAPGNAPAPPSPVLLATVDLPLAYVESSKRTDVLVNTLRLAGTRDPGGGVSNGRIAFASTAWRTEP